MASSSPRGPARRLRFAPDVSPLRESRPYRLLWAGQLVSVAGTQLRYVAVAYHVYLLTRSPLAVGLIGLFQGVPLIVFSVWGGVIADAADRRRMLLLTQAGMMAVSTGFALTTHLGLARVGVLYGLTAAAATLYALDGPARQSLVPSLVRRSQLPAATALTQVIYQTSSIAGPAAGGLVLARAGLAAAYWIDAATFAVSLLMLLRMPPAPARPGSPRPGVSSLREGLRYVRNNEMVWSTMAIDFVAMVFGWPRAMFPHFADRVFRVGPEGLGMLYAASGVGALLGALTGGWVSSVRHHGRAVIVSVAVYGVAVAAFGLLPAGGFVPALVLLAIAGGADVVSAIFRWAIVQLSVPDELRGRVAAVNLTVVTSGPRLGDVEAGIVGEVAGPRASVVSGGVLSLLGLAAMVAAVPRLWRFESEPEEVELPGAGPEMG